MEPLPEGLFACAACGAVRGRTQAGGLSVCFCQGVVCDWCGARFRRPISDYYDPRTRRWVHVPWFALGGHRCPAPSDRRTGRHFTVLPIVEEDLHAYRERMTRLAIAAMSDRPPGPSTKVH